MVQLFDCVVADKDNSYVWLFRANRLQSCLTEGTPAFRFNRAPPLAINYVNHRDFGGCWQSEAATALWTFAVQRKCAKRKRRRRFRSAGALQIISRSSSCAFRTP